MRGAGAELDPSVGHSHLSPKEHRELCRETLDVFSAEKSVALLLWFLLWALQELCSDF